MRVFGVIPLMLEKTRMLDFVLIINSVVLNFECVESCFRTLAVILLSDLCNPPKGDIIHHIHPLLVHVKYHLEHAPR